MLDQVIGEAMRPQASESLYTRTERATPDNDLKHGGSVNDFSFFNHPPDLPEFSTSSCRASRYLCLAAAYRFPFSPRRRRPGR